MTLRSAMGPMLRKLLESLLNEISKVDLGNKILDMLVNGLPAIGCVGVWVMGVSLWYLVAMNFPQGRYMYYIDTETFRLPVHV